VFFVNVHSLHLARKNGRFLHCVNGGDLVLADGSGLHLAGELLKTPIAENLNGTDFVPRVLREAEISRWSVYLLGARQEALERCEREIARKFPKLCIAGSHHGYFSKAEEAAILTEVNSAAPSILLVALGSPYQELWIGKYAPLLHARVCLGVGGLFDFLSGKRRRAPLWMRSCGIEWLFRFVVEPNMKWRRVLIEIPLFLLRLTPQAFRVRFSRNGQRASPWRERTRAHA
jgi:N-acetylglucosaminyldiphosphoundecaprenol N-acetyl-beta-D-mannosaminyltransferase